MREPLMFCTREKADRQFLVPSDLLVEPRPRQRQIPSAVRRLMPNDSAAC